MKSNQHHLRTHGSRWGPGKVHLRYGADSAECAPGVHVHGEPVGNEVPLTCKRCIKIKEAGADERDPEAALQAG